MNPKFTPHLLTPAIPKAPENHGINFDKNSVKFKE
jgi:hypothetical protein